VTPQIHCDYCGGHFLGKAIPVTLTGKQLRALWSPSVGSTSTQHSYTCDQQWLVCDTCHEWIRKAQEKCK
jgi:hypothetical protein